MFCTIFAFTLLHNKRKSAPNLWSMINVKHRGFPAIWLFVVSIFWITFFLLSIILYGFGLQKLLQINILYFCMNLCMPCTCFGFVQEVQLEHQDNLDRHMVMNTWQNLPWRVSGKNQYIFCRIANLQNFSWKE